MENAPAKRHNRNSAHIRMLQAGLQSGLHATSPLHGLTGRQRHRQRQPRCRDRQHVHASISSDWLDTAAPQQARDALANSYATAAAGGVSACNEDARQSLRVPFHAHEHHYGRSDGPPRLARSLSGGASSVGASELRCRSSDGLRRQRQQTPWPAAVQHPAASDGAAASGKTVR